MLLQYFLLRNCLERQRFRKQILSEVDPTITFLDFCAYIPDLLSRYMTFWKFYLFEFAQSTKYSGNTRVYCARNSTRHPVTVEIFPEIIRFFHLARASIYLIARRTCNRNVTIKAADVSVSQHRFYSIDLSNFFTPQANVCSIRE